MSFLRDAGLSRWAGEITAGEVGVCHIYQPESRGTGFPEIQREQSSPLRAFIFDKSGRFSVAGRKRSLSVQLTLPALKKMAVWSYQHIPASLRFLNWVYNSSHDIGGLASAK